MWIDLCRDDFKDDEVFNNLLTMLNLENDIDYIEIDNIKQNDLFAERSL